MLNLQFFGSDIFSIKSLAALHRLASARPDLIPSLQVVTRIPKKSGRGQNQIQEAPIVAFARDRGIQCLEAESPEDFRRLLSHRPTMAIAVSYGKLIPEEYLAGLRYGGLNVHPSLLPTYRGAAPLHRAILDRAKYTGVTVQTLDPHKFDHGKVLWQSDPVALAPQTTIQELRLKLADLGAAGLHHVLTQQLYLGEGFEPSWPKSWAKVISKSDQKLCHNTTLEEALAQANAFGTLYFEHPVERKNGIAQTTRTLLSDLEPVEGSGPSAAPISLQNNQLLFKLKNGRHLAANTVQAAGFASETPKEYFAKLNKRRFKINN